MISTADSTLDLGASRGVADGLTARDFTLLACVGVAILFAHREAVEGMVRLWNSSPMYSYGFTVPPISVYLLWTQRAALARLTPQPSVAIGAGLAVLAALCAVAARAGGIQVLDQLALLVSLTAAVFLLLGGAYVRASWAALAYLLLMIPIWDGLTERLHQPFQLRSAAIGLSILQALGIPAHGEGTLITLPGLTMEVARACSGVNYLVAVVALGLPLSYVFLEGTFRRVALLVSAVAVAALSNGLRVALIGVLAYYEVGSPLHGPFHVLHGLFVAGIGYVVLFAGLRLLAPRQSPAAAGAPESSSAVRTPIVARRPVSAVLAALSTIFFVVVGSNVLSAKSQPVTLAEAFDEFPSRLGTWVSEWDSAPASPGVFAGADVELRRRYRRPDGAVVQVYVGYFASQRQGRELASYRTTELHNRATSVRLEGGGRTIYANHVDIGADGTEMLFWYDVAGRTESNRYLVKARTLWNAVWQGRTNGAVVALTRVKGDDVATGALNELAPLVEDAVSARMSGARPTAGP